MPTTYEFKGTRTSHEGMWNIVRGTAMNPDAVVYQLDSDKPQPSLLLLKADDNVLLLLDRDKNLLRGDALWSYTLSRKDKETKEVSVANTQPPPRADAVLFAPSVFEGTTPCHPNARPLPLIPANTNCEQMIWKLELYFDQAADIPARYKLEAFYGVPQQNTTGLVGGGTRVTMEGTWSIVQAVRKGVERSIYQLNPDTPESSVFFANMDDNILLLLDRELNLMVGNGGWSYTLNRTE